MNRHVPEDSTPLVRQLDVVLFTDIPVDVIGGFILSMFELGLC